MKLFSTLEGVAAEAVPTVTRIAILGFALAVGTARAVPPPHGTAAISPPAGGFAVDGDLAGDIPQGGVGDWLAGTKGAAGVLNSAGQPLDPNITFHFIDPYGNSGGDLIFGGGLKWTDNPNDWSWTTGKPSSKTEINNVLMHIATDAEGHVWTVVAADRASTSGDSYIDFEFLQHPLVRTNNGKFVSGGPHGGRTVNDLLLCLAFTGGGKVADFFAWRWLPNGTGGYAYVDATASLPVGRVFVALNSNSVAVPYGAFGQQTYNANAFAEAAVDMTALLGSFDPCLSLGFKTIMVKTKASASSTASIEDFIDPIQYSLRVGPSADAGPDLAECTGGDVTLFAVKGKATAGLYPVASVSWSVVSGEATIDRPDALETVARVSSPEAVLRLTVSEAGGCVETDEVTLRVKPLPDLRIAGPETVCPGATVQFGGPAGMVEYAWTISGNGAISGPTNAPIVTVIAGENCDQDVTLVLKATSNGCSSTATNLVKVTDTTAPTLAAPADLVLECPADSGTNATGVAVAHDDCGAVAVAWTDQVTTTCGGGKVIARTWTATDRCGNTTRAVQTITLRDTRKPQLVIPPNVVLECPADTGTNRTGTATATDDCSAVVLSFSDQVTGQCGQTKVIARTWVATDACGNQASGLQTITVQDTTPPDLILPPNLTLECPADVSTNTTGVATASDACGQVVLGFSDSISNLCGGSRLVARTWTATDDCGNQSRGLQLITVRDTTKPALVVPPDVTLECPAETTTNATGMARAEDACGQVVIGFSDSLSHGCGGTRVIVRTWTATDECGNQASAVQRITVRDTLPPTLLTPPSLTLECPADTTTNTTGVATARDACGAVVIGFADLVTTNCGGARVVARTWTATDECGNSVSALQTITVRDTVKPALTPPPNLTLKCPADTSTNATGVAVARDDCGAVTVTCRDAVTNPCGNTLVISRTWTATDACGNSSSAVQTITVRDQTPPFLVLPADKVLECPADTRTNATGVAVAQDTCGAVVVSYSDVVSNSCGGAKVIARRWTAVDACGNSTQGVQTITVRDTTPPALTLPPNLTLECPGDTRTNVTGAATARDECGAAVVSYSDMVSNSCGLTRTVLRSWTAVDACGNRTNGLQTITVVDTRKPQITCPSLTVQCVGDVPAPYANLAAFLAAGGIASDACSSSLSFALVSDSGLVGSCPGRVTRVYRVTDECGNFAEGTQTILVRDTTRPVLVCPAPVTLEWGAPLDPATTGYATATDNCDTNVTVTYSDASVPSQYNIKFYAADPAPSHAPYLPTYLKLAPGSLACPDEARRTGRAADPLRNAVAYGPTSGQLDALTSLGGEPMALGQIVPFEVVIEVSGGSTRPENGTIEFTSAWSTHTTSNDEFGYDKDYMVWCAFVDVADPGLLDPNNNARVEAFNSVLVNAGTINERIQGTFRVAGLESGDRVVVEVWVVLMSRTPRNFGGTIAADLVSARKVASPPEPISIGTQTVSIGNLSKISPLPAPQEQPPLPPVPPQPPPLAGGLVAVIDRTWRGTDDCGNQSTCVQRLIVRDTTPPVLVLPPDLVLECPADIGTNATGVATAQDAAGEVTLTFSDAVEPGSGGCQLVARTWTATDACGNQTSGVQTIKVQDTTAPVLVAPPNLVVTEGEPWSFGQPQAHDGCDTPTVQVVSTLTNATFGAGWFVTRTWVATDGSGNQSVARQTITIAAAPLAPRILAHPKSQTGTLGGEVALEVVAVGSDPLAYQWRFNGAPLPGASGRVLKLGPLEFANAGVYTVRVSNAGGEVTSQPAIIDVAPVLRLERRGGGWYLVWPEPFILQSATTVAGPYTEVAGASSPYPLNTTEAPQKYFRLAPPPARTSISRLPGGETLVTLTGAPGVNYLLQASADLVTWETLQTSTAPGTCIDEAAGAYPMRFYRAVPALR